MNKIIKMYYDQPAFPVDPESFSTGITKFELISTIFAAAKMSIPNDDQLNDFQQEQARIYRLGEAIVEAEEFIKRINDAYDEIELPPENLNEMGVLKQKEPS